MKKIIQVSLFLAIISALSGALLSSVNGLTSPIIEERKIAAVRSTLEAIFPGASEFRELALADASGSIVNAYEASGAGFAFNVSIQGYANPITFIVAFDTTGKIVGFNVTAVNDTPGIGTKVLDDNFRDSIINKTLNERIDTIAGATVTSGAIVKGIDDAKAAFQLVR
jgi:Na+-translocating ferredoxin:NAD+ oxidoreductase RnfG subunit